MLYERDSHPCFPTAGLEEVRACADNNSHDHHEDDQNKDLCPFVSLSFKKLIMVKLIEITGVVGSWLGSIVAHLLALMISPVTSRVSKKFNPPHPLEARTKELLEEVKVLDGKSQSPSGVPCSSPRACCKGDHHPGCLFPTCSSPSSWSRTCW